MHSILSSIRSLPPYQHLLTQIKSGKQIAGLGLPRAARLPVLAGLLEDLNQPILFITDRSDHSLSLFDELGFWLKSPRFHFAEPNPLFYEQAAWGVTTRRDRLQALTALANYHLPFTQKPETPPVLIASVRSLMTRTMPRRDFLKACKKLSVNQTIQPDALLRSWAEIGYQRVNTVLEPGQFSSRGGILDIWATAETMPVRLDFFGDEIETIRKFDPASQRTIEKLDSILVTPAREYLVRSAVELLNDQHGEYESELSEFHIPLLHSQPATLLDYLPQKAVVLIDDVSIIESMAEEVEAQAVKFRQDSIAEETLSSDFPLPYIPWSELYDGMGERAVELGFSTNEERLDTRELENLSACFGHDERFGGRLKPFVDYVAGLAAKGEPVVIVSRQAKRLEELWLEASQADPASEPPIFIESSLSEGFTLSLQSPVSDDQLPITNYQSLHLITDSEIFGWERPQPRTRQRPVAETPESVYADLDAGDFVVHIDHGVGRFGGLVQRELDGHVREFLAVEYEGDGQLYVPVHQADRLTRYVGAEGAAPALDRLGGQEWHEKKGRVKAAVLEVAQEMLDLYARRHVAQGYAFKPDTAWQKELEDSFPYVETDDQKRALADIKRDMESTRPMDRLLCGDVGYGKTEVALRAAFKAVMDGKQVAILVPTTVLAQQHYETFLQRLAAFPVKVEMLSRFRTPREQAAILHGLAIGEIDIVVGTHRLISGDVQFKELGLVVIDEEQRFGVTHKEHLKKLRTEVDVLTLTATPIPRTLYMALTGVRDISNLNTPPEERLPIATHVGPYSPKLVRQAILRELERGGQIFFVHNRVQTIDAMKAHLHQLVPEANVDIGHGQMPENQLSEVMHRFNNGDTDILLSTTIIESGLDIPNANTLIVDRADTFGLAQLYQLRGRVGRGAARAYSYFFRHNKMSPTQEGQQRLEVIAENTQLGAGYSIAMRDLEIRGAGELLGTRQSGHIQAVGFHLYTRLLADAVRRLRYVDKLTGSQVNLQPVNLETFQPLSMPVNVDLPLAVGIPAEYIPDQDLRLRLYRRIADLRDETEIEALASEFKDRFGDLPEMTENLFYQMRVKLRAEKAGLSSINWESGQIVLRYPASANGSEPKRLADLGAGIRGGKNAYWCSFGEDWEGKLLEVLGRL
ncbi:MAG: transcription-repair coupling factor [Anaerolineae bacterium]|nr:MAG: transcription-repair coupling factor [Anaerolineae bacterium]WKZ45249.1 MAG: transcription-repair coupling factor [Anaerolineales bacterium]